MGAASRITEFLASHIAAGDFPGACYLVSEDRRILEEGALGEAIIVPERVPATPATLYDLASLTKPLATALIAAQLQAEGRLHFEDRLAAHLPAWSGASDRDGITLLDLLTHRSGLPGWKPLYLHARDREDRVAWLRQLPLAHRPGEEVEYSDLGYILLGFALERVGGAPLDRLFADRVASPLGIADLGYLPAADRHRIAATETGNERERALAGAEGAGYNGWRTEVIWGEVHDVNAHTLGGVSGHAGVFGTARGVLAVALEFLGAGRDLLPHEQLGFFLRSFTTALSEERSVGFQLASSKGSSAGPALPGSAIGHTGFTGTSLWIDPLGRRVYILLTNRVHPRFREINMNAIRREFHRLAAAL